MDANAKEAETKQIEAIAKINGFNLNARTLKRRRKLHNKKLLELTGTTLSTGNHQPERTKWFNLPYLGNLSDKLANELGKYGYRTGFYLVETMQELTSLEDPVE